jgi:predicted glycoside hydrolase/deacetylase ChbG (UPF0249 family)
MRSAKSFLFLISFLLSSSILHAQDKSIKLLVRADDMGNSYGRSTGIIKAYKDGIVTSAGLMPTSPFFNESVEMCKKNPDLVTGIHLTLLATRTRPVLSPELIPSLVTPEGFFHETLPQLLQANPSEKEMEMELRAQIGKVRTTGLNFIYLDWHRAVPPAAEEIIKRICREEKLVFGQDYKYGDKGAYGYILLNLMPETWPTLKAPDGQTVHYAAPAFTEDQKEIFYKGLEGLKPGKWMLMVHPGLGEPQRSSVAEVLSSQRTKDIIKKKNIRLISYYDIWKEEFGAK